MAKVTYILFLPVCFVGLLKKVYKNKISYSVAMVAPPVLVAFPQPCQQTQDLVHTPCKKPFYTKKWNIRRVYQSDITIHARVCQEKSMIS